MATATSPQPPTSPAGTLLPGESVSPSGTLSGPHINRGPNMVPHGYPIPDQVVLGKLEPWQQLRVAQAYGWYPPPSEYQEEVATYVARFSKIPPGQLQAAEVARLTDPLKSRRAALGLARRSQRTYQQAAATAGAPNTELVWVAEDDDASCGGCIKRQGDGAMTLAEHEAEGKPGSQECGENCRCDLMPADAKTGGAAWLVAGVAAAAVIAAIVGEAIE